MLGVSENAYDERVPVAKALLSCSGVHSHTCKHQNNAEWQLLGRNPKIGDSLGIKVRGKPRTFGMNNWVPCEHSPALPMRSNNRSSFVRHRRCTLTKFCVNCACTCGW